MNRALTCLGGMGLGAGAMYFFDPDLGRRRRALVRDQIVHASHQFADCLDTAWRDLSNRARGMMAEAFAMFRGDQASDEVLAARVRTKLGRYVSHPRSIQVSIHDGCVVLSGPVLANEAQNLISAILSLRGVIRVDDRLDVHEESGDISGLQGGRKRAGEPLEWAQVNWSPAGRLLAGMAGGALLGIGCTRRFPVACALGTLGVGLLTRAVANRPLIRPTEACRREERQEPEMAAATPARPPTSAGAWHSHRPSHDGPGTATDSPQLRRQSDD